MPEITTIVENRGRFEGGRLHFGGSRIKYQFRTEAEIWDWWDRNETQHFELLARRRTRFLASLRKNGFRYQIE